MGTTLSSMRACIDYVARPKNHQSSLKQNHDVDMHWLKLNPSYNSSRFQRAQIYPIYKKSIPLAAGHPISFSKQGSTANSIIQTQKFTRHHPCHPSLPQHLLYQHLPRRRRHAGAVLLERFLSRDLPNRYCPTPHQSACSLTKGL